MSATIQAQVEALALPTETLAEALSRMCGKNRGFRYQNGVRPGPRKLDQFKECLRIRGTPPICSQDGKGMEAIAYVKLFDPCGSWTWYLTEWDGESEAFGLVVGHETEFGYIPLCELADVPGRMGIGIEIDMHWMPRTLKEAVR
jgi:hypothetical protein